MKRIFDDPNHPQYGPVRRMWVVLVQLDLLNAAERYGTYRRMPWDEMLAGQLLARPTVRESIHQRGIIGILLEGWS